MIVPVLTTKNLASCRTARVDINQLNMMPHNRSASVAFWMLLCISLEQATSFTPFTCDLKNQHNIISNCPVLLPTTRFSNVLVEHRIPTSTQLSTFSIRNVIATALHHDPNDHHVMMAGSIWPILQKLFTAPMKLRLIIHNIVSITEWQECILLPILAFGITPFAKLCYRASGENERPMQDMKRFGIVAIIDQISKVALSVYAMDVISITLTTIGFTFAKEWRIAEVYAKFACTCILPGTWYIFLFYFVHYGCRRDLISFIFTRLPLQIRSMPYSVSYCTRN